MKSLRRLTLTLFMFFMSSPHVLHVAAVGGDTAQAPGPVVTTAWLASRAGDANVVVISSDDEQRFAAGHIAGVDPLRAHQRGPMVLHELAEGIVGVLLHGRQDGRVLDGYAGDLHGSRQLTRN